MSRRRASRTEGLLQSGRSVLSDDAWNAIAESLNLSQRETQIVQGVFDDLKDTAIAEELGISRHTVHTHIRRMYLELTSPNQGTNGRRGNGGDGVARLNARLAKNGFG